VRRRFHPLRCAEAADNRVPVLCPSFGKDATVLSCVCGLRRAICVELRVEITLTPILGPLALDQLHRQVDSVANGRI